MDHRTPRANVKLEETITMSFTERLLLLIITVLIFHHALLGDLPLHDTLFNFVPKFPDALINVINITPSAAKPYDTFSNFYPEYLKQHQDITCIRLHYIGTSIIILLAVFDSKIPISIVLGGVVGHILFHFTRGMDNGAIEGLGMIGTYLLGYYNSYILLKLLIHLLYSLRNVCIEQ